MISLKFSWREEGHGAKRLGCRLEASARGYVRVVGPISLFGHDALTIAIPRLAITE